MKKQILIKRKILKELKSHLNKKEISLIVGPRQVGKTTLMNELKQYLDSINKKTCFLSLDFEKDKKFFISQSNLIQKLELEFGNKKGYVFIDEIQRKENAGLFLKGVYDMNLPYKFIVSGSESLELKEKIHESLMGRKRLFEMTPVGFDEFVNFKTDYRYENKLKQFFATEEELTKNFLEEYLNFGGYPKIILAKKNSEKLIMINEIYRSYIDKDISNLLEIKNLEAFNSLIKLLASQIGGLINYSKIADALDVSTQTIKNYIWYAQKTFIIQKITPYFKNKRKEITKSPNIYFYDLGLRNFSVDVFGNLNRIDETGFVFQNFILNILKEKLRLKNITIHFWRTKDMAEVDFVIELGKDIIPIEVKYKNFKQPVVERSLRNFINKYHPRQALIINKNFKHILNINKTKVEFVRFWEISDYFS